MAWGLNANFYYYTQLSYYYRIQDVVGKACIITWSKKIYTQLISYVEVTAKRIDSILRNETEKRDSKYIIG